jgi:hypothetical protein
LYDLSSFDVEGSAIGNDAASDAQGAAPDALGDSFVPDADAAMPGEDNADASPQAVDDGPDAPNEVAADGTDADAEPPHTEQPDGQSVSDSASGATVDAAEAGPSQADTGPIDSAGGSDAGTDAAHPPPANDAGLVAYYPFAETTGTTTADDSGNNETATMQGATFTTGVQGNAATMSGMNQYVSLPPNIVFGLTAFSVCEWVNLNAPIPQHAHIFDFGTGTNDYMFLTPNSGIGTLQFAITTGGVAAEQRLDAPPLAAGMWDHVCVTSTGTTAVLYLNGEVVKSAAMTLNPSSLGPTTQDWLGRSQSSSDPYLNGKIDNFRIYNRALSASEVMALFAGMD